MLRACLPAASWGAIGLVVVLSCALYYSGGDGLRTVPDSESALVYGGQTCLNLVTYAQGCGAPRPAGGKCPSACYLYSGTATGGLIVKDTPLCNPSVAACGQYIQVGGCLKSGFAGPQ
jgi:hypothetical protein